MRIAHQSRTNQRGSALLIVFVFAAIVAIMLFTQMPVIIFEAQRNKEQLLIDRGNEYSQAIKIYLRKTGRYPPSIDALENTNRIRFLRKKFKDPFTDKADWRLLHAGPNGMLIDSKIKQNQLASGPNHALGTFNSNGDNQSSPFGNTSAFGSNNSLGGTNNGANGFNTGGNSTGFAGLNTGAPVATNRPPATVTTSNGAANPLFQGGIAPNAAGIDPNQLPTQAQAAAGLAQAAQLAAQSTAGIRSVDGQAPSGPRSIPNGTNGSAIGVIDPTQAGGGGFASSTGIQSSGDPNNPNAAVGGLISNPNTPTPQTNGFSNSTGQGSAFGNSSFGNSAASNSFGSSSTNSFGSNNAGNSTSNSAFGSSTFGNTQSGNLAGVASKVERHSIKSVNDQKDYSLWEFYYDPAKDPLRNGASALSQVGTGSAGQPGNSTTTPGGTGFGQQSTFGNQSSPFGNRQANGGTNSGFGGFGNGSGSGFGNSQSQSGQTPPTGAQPQPVTPPQPPPQ